MSEEKKIEITPEKFKEFLSQPGFNINCKQCGNNEIGINLRNDQSKLMVTVFNTFASATDNLFAYSTTCSKCGHIDYYSIGIVFNYLVKKEGMV